MRNKVNNYNYAKERFITFMTFKVRDKRIPIIQ